MPRPDPRLYQIAMLSSLLVYGFGWLDFEIGPVQAVVTLVTVLVTQYGCTRLWRLPQFDPKSALISGLSLCLLLRCNELWVAGLGAFVSIAGKFLLRVNGKHVFNPTNLGVAVMLLSGRAWLSPGQWGSTALLAFLFACLGGLVVNRAERSDVTYAFLAFYLAMLFGRSYLLGEPMTIPLHRTQSGAFLLFTFFMISDPRTTPDSRLGRVLFAGMVAAGAWYIQFRMFHTNALIWSLAGCSLLTPLIDRIFVAARHAWPAPASLWRTA